MTKNNYFFEVSGIIGWILFLPILIYWYSHDISLSIVWLVTEMLFIKCLELINKEIQEYKQKQE